MAGEKAPQAPSQSNPDFEAGTQVTIDPEKEKKLVRKLDKYLIPAYMITYISAVLDRSIIGNAKVAGMADDLHLVGSEFNGMS